MPWRSGLRPDPNGKLTALHRAGFGERKREKKTEKIKKQKREKGETEKKSRKKEKREGDKSISHILISGPWQLCVRLSNFVENVTAIITQITSKLSIIDSTKIGYIWPNVGNGYNGRHIGLRICFKIRNLHFAAGTGRNIYEPKQIESFSERLPNQVNDGDNFMPVSFLRAITVSQGD